MKILISGGCKNGKSDYAQSLAARLSPKHYYMATMIPCDAEDNARIQKHIESRAGMGFVTLDAARNIKSCLNEADKHGAFLLDSVTALLLNEMFPDFSGGADPNAAERCRRDLLDFAELVDNVVFVSDYIYSDALRYDEFTENYRASLAMLDRALAEVCDVVIEACAGNLYFHKGENYAYLL